ncbi:hypothetical protein M0R88_14360 [Halorussus gelatinilyticus]|uniref:Uncharacterized protein n=1 Tax=Halorussus gelatinilyticus TaxID=2937524 RepID=A0A8U0IG65_9EURY|nr:hypothetical protein [Halorussus gelatinilyticus]UPV99690.1 hypothetical protein M0R88_14360 [Halorussus gelatinilyticus]
METFRTKRGRCVLTDDELRLESGLYLQARRYWEGNKPLLAGYICLYGALAVAAVRVVRAGDWRAIAVGALAVTVLFVVGRTVNRRRGVGSADRIPLHDVESVAAVEGDDWLTRPRFVVRYWRGGGVKRRDVMMPSGLLSYGESEFERAKRRFRERGIPVETVRPGDADESSA